ncbi:hypothetical protein NP493_1613g00029 [Ridgeia piscesae]|uniref:Uncharacterized protein n=1 Tax=Ridgeia piscesae TaxID=27915 RepID=A0AAD9JYB0_RIDPI|nr:hypothetical protein NP493_1613g00029 [Ridgeia piscesae]
MCPEDLCNDGDGIQRPSTQDDSDSTNRRTKPRSLPKWLDAWNNGRDSNGADAVSGAVAQWRSGAVAQWRSGAVEQWRSGAVAQWRSGAVAQWRSGAVAQWRSGAVAQWSSGAVAQWRSGQNFGFSAKRRLKRSWRHYFITRPDTVGQRASQIGPGVSMCWLPVIRESQLRSLYGLVRVCVRSRHICVDA